MRPRLAGWTAGAATVVMLGGTAWPAHAQEAGTTIPGAPASVYSFDTSHSAVTFAVRHLGLTRVRGSFPVFFGTMLLDENDLSRSSVSVVVDMSSVDTGNGSRDERLTETFFDVASHPYMIFQSQRVQSTADGMLLRGTLQLNGVRREVEISTEHVGSLQAPEGDRHAFEGELLLERKQFGIEDSTHPFEKAGAIGEEVTILLEIQAVESDPASTPFFSFRAPSVGEALYETARSEGVEAAVARYGTISADSADAFTMGAREIVVAARKLTAEGRAGVATEILEALLDRAPDSAPLHGALGEALLADGAAEEGMRHLQRAVTLEPRATRAREMLRWWGERLQRPRGPGAGHTEPPRRGGRGALRDPRRPRRTGPSSKRVAHDGRLPGQASHLTARCTDRSGIAIGSRGALGPCILMP